MSCQFSGRYANTNRFILVIAATSLWIAAADRPAYGFGFAILGDYNHDGIVSHADYSVLADTFGQRGAGLPADGDGDMVISNGDFDIYRTHYGGAPVLLPGVLPFAVNAAASPGGNIEWTLAFSDVNGGLAGHLNISTNGPSVLSALGGPGFLDDGDGTLDVPGKNAMGAIQAGISINGNQAFAALGTTLSTSPLLHDSHSTLEFLRLVTAGNQPTTLTYSGEYGYQSLDYMITGSATSVPEPAGVALLVMGGLGACVLMTRKGHSWTDSAN